MIDLGISKLALIGVVALVVIGPEKLPRVVRTVGALFGKAQRYVADVKAEVSRSIDLEELQRMKASVQDAAQHVESSIHQTVRDVNTTWHDSSAGFDGGFVTGTDAEGLAPAPSYPQYRHPRKRFRLKQKAVPQWYKARTGTRTRVQSGAARVARYRPKTRPF
ncbi:MAG: Sec-independent protein translocase protein TatB [Macromonas bipunctata]|jgi:sec-independent protein translocase protein TatB|uniref:Sec-independent protein translocase protein TatB n=1 Tax=Macromonas bipunctata TaxID=183670 RepID=UPI000C332AD4|nr:Sec-independent protein translocase protein TatB [Macromonas bipunctata]MDD2535837.1 Sec-independent protein translocase protein TatB [Macromonas bipunctata]